jgi:hypothetical protein
MNRIFLATSLLSACAMTAPAHAAEPLQLNFVDHLQMGLNELDIFVTRPGVPGEAYRVSPNTALVHLASPLYASAEPVPHNPFDAQAIGPHPLGRPLGLSLRDWRAAEGSAEVHCRDGQATVNARFTNLVPNATYSLWYAFVPSPPTVPFTGALDLPLGARDGSQSVLHSDAAGNAEYHASFTPCLQASGEQLMAMLGLAWHSDGQTYGSSPGEFGSRSHVQLFAPLPPLEH